MAKLRCRCGNVIRMSGEIPNPIEWKIISDQQFDLFEGMVDVEEIYTACSSMFRCVVCRRIWVFWDGLDSDPVSYSLDEEPFTQNGGDSPDGP